MNWDAVGALGEWVGALAVLATLVYLAVQIKQNSQSTRANIELEASRQLAQFVSRISADSNLKRIYDEIAESKPLSFEDERDYLWLVAEFFHSAEGVYIQHVKGFLSEDIWGEYERLLVGFLQSAEAQKWWENSHGPFSEPFRKCVNVILNKPVGWVPIGTKGTMKE